MIRRSLAVVVGTAMLAMLSGGVFAQAPEKTGVVHTEAGDVQGVVINGIGKFLGIPYAAPPTGELRWRPPQEPKHWSQTFQASEFGKTCAQQQRGVFAAPSNDEDCLYLNVFTKGTAVDAAAKRPVMVWFYGGGLFSGESNDYDGSKLVSRDVVFVSMNYRIGALGFLSHPSINAEGHPFANYGVMDQQFALKWVQRNIAAFGGDPQNVTIFGQSGGGTAVMANLQSPLSQGLFHKAINQSGTRIALTTPEMSVKLGQEFATAAGCADQTAECLRSLSVEQVLKNQGPVVSRVSDFPSVDGTVITRPAFEAFRDGQYNHVPIMTGLVRDEQAFFLPEPNTKKPLSEEEFRRYAASFGATHADELLKKYPLESYGSPSLAEIAMAQGSKACTARLLDRQWSKYAPLYAYQFEDRTAPSYFPAVSYPMRAYHTAELQYLFPLFRGGQGTSHPLSDAQLLLSDMMVDYWTTFARTGNPNPSATAAPPAWLAYAGEHDNVQVLDLPAPKAWMNYGHANDCDMWDAVLPFK